MSFRLSVEVWDLDLEPSEKFILFKMVSNGNDEGTHCFPSIRRIAHETGYNVRTVIRVIKKLEEAGIVVVAARGNQHSPNQYIIHLEKAKKLPKFVSSSWSKAEEVAKRASDTMSLAKQHESASDIQSKCHPEQEQVTSTTRASDTMSSESIHNHNESISNLTSLIAESPSPSARAEGSAPEERYIGTVNLPKQPDHTSKVIEPPNSIIPYWHSYGPKFVFAEHGLPDMEGLIEWDGVQGESHHDPQHVPSILGEGPIECSVTLADLLEMM